MLVECIYLQHGTSSDSVPPFQMLRSADVALPAPSLTHGRRHKHRCCHSSKSNRCQEL